MGREAKIPVTDRLKGECSGIFSRNISGGDTAPVCDGIYVSERPDRQERNLLARHRNHCTRLRTVAQHGKEGVEGSGGKGIFEERNPSQGKWGGLLQTAIPFCKEKGHTWGKVCPDSGPGIGAGWTDRKETGEESNRGRREKCHEMQ